MKDIPGFINELVHALASCEDVDEPTIMYLSLKLLGSPEAAGLLASFAEIGYSNNEMVMAECNRLLVLTGGR